LERDPLPVPAEEIQRRMTRFEEALRRAGAKLTHQRREVFLEVAASEDHPDATEIYQGVRERIPTISLDTVYRTLGLLRQLGAIATIGRPRQRERFDGNTALHHHFVCMECGSVRDFDCDRFDRLTVPTDVKRIGEIENAHVEVRGRCRECVKENRKT